jgi:hypothetical protein
MFSNRLAYLFRCHGASFSELFYDAIKNKLRFLWRFEIKVVLLSLEKSPEGLRSKTYGLKY